MMQRINKTVVLLFMALSSSLQAVSTVIEPTNPTPVSTSELVCNLPPPSFFSTLQVGPTWANVGWSAVPGAFAYRIITSEAATGIVVDNSIVPAFVAGLTIDSLTPNTVYVSRIWSVCSNGQNGNGHNTTGPTTIILDIVSGGYTAPQGCLMETCLLDTLNDVCTFSWNSNVNTYFKVRPVTGVGERFFMLRADGDNLNFYPDDNLNSPYSFEKVNNQAIRIFHTKFSKDTIANVSANRDNLLWQGSLFRQILTENNFDYTIARLDVCPEGKSGEPISWSKEAIQLSPAAYVVAAPNPFTDQLDVRINFPIPSEQVTIRLFNIQGQEVSFQQEKGGLQTYSLPTTDLQPGVYFLRVESAGQTHTTKVVKTR
ncbi:MAG: T9SS type A sorting domain-containing protein [Saprospiraceae bacterium]